MCRRDIPASAKLVFACLAMFGGGARKAWPAIPTIAQKTGLSERQVRRHLCTLGDRGWISRRARPGQSSHYDLSTPDTADSADTGDRSSMTPLPDTDVRTSTTAVTDVRTPTVITPDTGDPGDIGDSADTGDRYPGHVRPVPRTLVTGTPDTGDTQLDQEKIKNRSRKDERNARARTPDTGDRGDTDDPADTGDLGHEAPAWEESLLARARDLWCEQERLRSELRDDGIDPTHRALGLTPSRERLESSGVVDAVRVHTDEELRHVLAVLAAEARAKRSLRWLNGMSNWHPRTMARALGMTPESAAAEVYEHDESRVFNVTGDEDYSEVEL